MLIHDIRRALDEKLGAMPIRGAKHDRLAIYDPEDPTHKLCSIGFSRGERSIDNEDLLRHIAVYELGLQGLGNLKALVKCTLDGPSALRIIKESTSRPSREGFSTPEERAECEVARRLGIGDASRERQDAAGSAALFPAGELLRHGWCLAPEKQRLAGRPRPGGHTVHVPDEREPGAADEGQSEDSRSVARVALTRCERVRGDRPWSHL